MHSRPTGADQAATEPNARTVLQTCMASRSLCSWLLLRPSLPAPILPESNNSSTQMQPDLCNGSRYHAAGVHIDAC